MELLLLLGLGAFLLTRTQNTTVTSAAAAQSAAAAAAAASGMPTVELSRIRLPHYMVTNPSLVDKPTERIWTLPEVPSNLPVVYKFVECKQPGGANRILDIQNKFAQWETANTAWINGGRPRQGKFMRAKVNASNAYALALTAHLQNCTNYQKQL
jgi:hypothetical protein